MPYRDGGSADIFWKIEGLQSAVEVQGTLNEPGDRDRGWTVELAIPWMALAAGAPSDGEQWRVNFSRVEWDVEVVDGAYRKVSAPALPGEHPEHNWVWSPQGAVNMHMPEMWGVVEFRDAARTATAETARSLQDWTVQQGLRRLYHAQRAHRTEHGGWAADIGALAPYGIANGGRFEPSMGITVEGWRATAIGASGRIWSIRQDGRIGSQEPSLD